LKRVFHAQYVLRAYKSISWHVSMSCITLSYQPLC